ncbi:MAG: toll/interleukin-1 receptor domain-containing protein, partial [Nitrososphaerales archaeon]
MNSTSSPAFDLFIAHASADRAWVHGFLLPALALPAHCVITPDSFEPGAPVVTEFTRAVRSSRYTVLVLSPAFLADAWLQFGDELASFARVEDGHNRLIPVDLQPVELPLHLEFLVRLDATRDAGWPAVAGRLRELLDRPEPVETSLPCPYPGM